MISKHKPPLEWLLYHIFESRPSLPLSKLILNFQAAVRKNYEKLFDQQYWQRIDTDEKTEAQVYEEVKKLALEVIEGPKSKETDILWPMEES